MHIILETLEALLWWSEWTLHSSKSCRVSNRVSKKNSRGIYKVKCDARISWDRVYTKAIFSPACMYTFAVFSPVLLFIMLSLGLLSRLVNLSVTLGTKPLPCRVTIETTAIFTQKVRLINMKVMAALLGRFLVCTHSGSCSVKQNYVIESQISNFSMITAHISFFIKYFKSLHHWPAMHHSFDNLVCNYHVFIVVTYQYQTNLSFFYLLKTDMGRSKHTETIVW